MLIITIKMFLSPFKHIKPQTDKNLTQDLIKRCVTFRETHFIFLKILIFKTTNL